MWKWMIIVGVVPLLSGCAALAPLIPGLIPTGSANAAFHTGTEVKLEQANFRILKPNVVGECKGFALFGIITLDPARFSTAMDRVQSRAAIVPGTAQTLANVVVERSSSYWILFSIPRVSIRADVVEFIPPATNQGDPPARP